MDRELQRSIVKKLVAIGGKEWNRMSMHRVYLNIPGWAAQGLEMEFYNTGNVKDATFNGKHISNNRANKLMQDELVKLYFDVTTLTWNNPRIARRLLEKHNLEFQIPIEG